MSKMTREELMAVLRGDQTLDEIEAAIEAGEMNQDEWGRICDFLREDDRLKADQLFDEILMDIDSRPAYDDGKAELKGWREYRSEVAHEIKEIKDKQFECEHAIADLSIEFDDINDAMKGRMSEQDMKDLEALRAETMSKMQDKYKELDELAKRHSALTLMHAEAKDFVKQAHARVFLEQTEPVRKGIGFAIDGVKLRAERAKEAVVEIAQNLKKTREQNKETKKMVRESDNISFHPWKDLKNKLDIAEAKSAFKEANYWKQESAKAADKMLKEQQKLIEKAQKIMNKEAKPTFMEKLEAWSKGEKVTPKEPEKVADLDRAKEILEQSGKFNDKKYEGYKLDVKIFDQAAARSMDEALSAMERVSERLIERQRDAVEMQKDFEQKLENGELNHNENMLDEIQQNIDDAFNRGFLDSQSFDKDMLDMLRENGMGNIIDNNGIEGFEDPEAPEFGDQDGPEIEEQDAPEIG